MRLVLCRHARTGDASGAARLADSLRRLPVAAVYTSPLERALVTATAVAAAHGLEPVVVDDLREIDFGETEGLGFDELPPEVQRGLLEQPTRVRFPSGETFGELRRRVVESIETLVERHDAETVVAISHAGAIRAALATWLLMSDEGVFRIDQRYASINVAEWHSGTPLISVVNAAQL